MARVGVCIARFGLGLIGRGCALMEMRWSEDAGLGTQGGEVKDGRI